HWDAGLFDFSRQDFFEERYYILRLGNPAGEHFVDDVALREEIQALLGPHGSGLQAQQPAAEILERALEIDLEGCRRDPAGSIAQDAKQAWGSNAGGRRTAVLPGSAGFHRARLLFLQEAIFQVHRPQVMLAACVILG